MSSGQNGTVDFQELTHRIARLEEAGRPLGARQESVDYYPSRPRGLVGEGIILYGLPDGAAGLGYGERGQFSDRKTFPTSAAACESVWEDFATGWVEHGAGRPAYLVRALFPPRSESPEDARAAASAPTADLATFATHPDTGVRRTVARRVDCPPSVLGTLESTPECHSDLADNPSTPPDTLNRLAGSPDAGVRALLAGNPATPQPVLDALASDEEPSVVWRVARAATTGFDALAASRHPFVRRFLAQNPSTPSALLRELSVDPDFAVRWAVATHPATPVDVLGLLATDSDYGVRWGAARNPSARNLDALVNDEETGVRFALALNPTVSPALLARLAGDRASRVRRQVAKHPETPPSALDALARDEDWTVALWVGDNQAASPEAKEHAKARRKAGA